MDNNKVLGQSGSFGSGTGTIFLSCEEYLDTFGIGDGSSDDASSMSDETVYHLSRTGGSSDEENQTYKPIQQNRSHLCDDSSRTRNNFENVSVHEQFIQEISLSKCDSLNILQQPGSDEDTLKSDKVPNGLWKRWRASLEPKRAWFLLFCTIVPINAMLGMDFIGFSIYYVAYAQHFPNESRSSIGVIVAIKETLMCFFGLVTSVLITRYGCRTVAMSGGATLFIAFLASSFSPNIYMLYVTQGVLAGVGCSLCLLSPNYLLHKNFNNNRALAGGLGMLGTTVGNMLGVSFIDYLIKTYGWRGSLLIQSGIAANIIPLALLMPQPNSNSSQNSQNISDASSKREPVWKQMRVFIKEMLDFSLFKEVLFLLVSFGSMLDRFNTFTFMHHMPSRAVHLGMTRTDGAMYVSACAMTILVCRLLVTILSNLRCANRVLLYSVGCFVGGLGSYLIVILSDYIGQILGSVVVGIHVGMTNTLTWVMLVDLLSMRRFARAMALHDLFVGVAAFSAAPFGGYLYDKTGCYDPTFLVAGSCNISGGVLILAACIMDRIKRKKENTERLPV